MKTTSTTDQRKPRDAATHTPREHTGWGLARGPRRTPANERASMLHAGSGDRSIRRAAVVEGSALLVMTVLSIYAFAVAVGGLVVDGDAARTASNIAEAEGTFRIGVACFTLVALLDVVIAWAVRVLFAPVSEIVSSLAAAARVAYAAVLLVATGHLVVASQLLTGPEGRAGLATSELQAQGLLQIDAFNAVWNAGLALFGFHLLLVAYLVIRSSYVPTWVGVLLVPAGGGYIVDSFGSILLRDYSVSVAAFTFVGEALLMLWLLARGRRIRLRAPVLPGREAGAMVGGR